MSPKDDDTQVSADEKNANIAEDGPPKPKKKKEPVNLLKVLRRIFVGKPKPPKDLAREKIINEQRILEFLEINETWKFVFGPEVPKKWKDCLEIKDVTQRRIWMEAGFIFDEVKTHKPDEIFHDISKYCFMWRPPDSSFKLCIPLNSPTLLEQSLLKYARMTLPGKNLTFFHFTTIDSTMPMFRLKVHPATLVRFEQRNEVMGKLCDLFLEGTIPLTDLNNVMECGFDTWKITLYNYLPADWQPFHRYLAAEHVKTQEKSPEFMYMNEMIDLQEYHDLKYPERARIRKLEKATYPLPYTTDTCIVCHTPDTGIIKCQNCDNQVCVECVKRIFLDDETKEGAFLLMHRRYCMHLGAYPNQLAPSLPEPAYLRNLRLTGSAVAYDKLMLEPEEEEEEEEDEEEEDEEDEEARRLRELAELERIEYVVLDLRDVYEKRLHRFHHLERDILENQEHIDEGGHGDPYLARMARLNAEAFTKCKKLAKQVKNLLDDLTETEQELLEEKGRANGVEDLRHDASRILEMIDCLLAIESVEQYQESLKSEEQKQAEAEEKEKAEGPAAADLLASFG